MKTFIIVGIIFIIIIAALKQTKQGDRKKPTLSKESFHFTRRDFLTPTEFKFFRSLWRACHTKYYIVPKVGLWALVDDRDNYSAWNKISRKHIDFTLCDLNTMTPLVVIELDDWTHNSNDQKRRDNEKDAILKSAGIPILRFVPLKEYNETAIIQLIETTIKKNR